MMFASLAAKMLAVTVLAAADGVPIFNVEPGCRDVASKAAPIGSM